MTDFQRIYEENQGFILKYLQALCRDPALAEELTQETFFKAYMNLASVRDPGKIPIWLCQIAKNTYYAWYNQQKHLVPLEEAKLAAGEDPQDRLLRKELTRQALAALKALEEPYKKVLILRLFGGLSLTQISKIFGKSESWARVTFYRAKQKLLERMENDGM